jgi:hypothetical protein
VAEAFRIAGTLPGRTGLACPGHYAVDALRHLTGAALVVAPCSPMAAVVRWESFRLATNCTAISLREGRTESFAKSS